MRCNFIYSLAILLLSFHSGRLLQVYVTKTLAAGKRYGLFEAFCQNLKYYDTKTTLAQIELLF
jgi:hypothetical protein